MPKFETSDTLPKYFKEIDEVANFMTKEEEQALARRIQKGDEVALNKLIQANLKYVVTMANKFIGQGVPIDDLIQEGNLGLYEAARRYTPDQGKVLTYAKFWIQKHLNLALCEQGRTVRLPVNREYEIFKQKKQGLTVNLSNVSIDKKIGDEGSASLGDLIVHSEFNDPFDQEEQARTIRILLSSLKPVERRIVELFYGLGDEEKMSTKDVAKLVGKTPAEVNRTLKVARSKMRKKTWPRRPNISVFLSHLCAWLFVANDRFVDQVPVGGV
jgi:RNA polymerase primary sigma factor